MSSDEVESLPLAGTLQGRAVPGKYSGGAVCSYLAPLAAGQSHIAKSVTAKNPYPPPEGKKDLRRPFLVAGAARAHRAQHGTGADAGWT